jgi:hypothetical protein
MMSFWLGFWKSWFGVKPEPKKPIYPAVHRNSA